MVNNHAFCKEMLPEKKKLHRIGTRQNMLTEEELQKAIKKVRTIKHYGKCGYSIAHFPVYMGGLKFRLEIVEESGK